MKTLLFVLAVLLFSPASAQSFTANQIIEKIKQNVTCEWTTPTVDKIVAGDGDTKITGIATTFMATMEVLEKAVAENFNMIITHEPTFYNHFDEIETLKGDPVLARKIAYIKKHNLVIFRFHDYLHRTDPDGIYEGVIKRLGWKDYRTAGSGYTFEIPVTNLGQLRQDFADLFNSGIVRGLGNPEMEISKVGMVLGAAGRDSHINAIRNDEIDVLLVGEAVEWETIPYFQDGNTLGDKKGLIILGHADSEEAGMDYCASWLSAFITIPLKFVPSGNPMWGGVRN